MQHKFDTEFILHTIGSRNLTDADQQVQLYKAQQAIYEATGVNPTSLKQTMFDRIKAMSEDELADFFFESPEIEFGLCAYCENFNGAGNPEPCSSIYCDIGCKNKAFKKYLRVEID